GGGGGAGGHEGCVEEGDGGGGGVVREQRADRGRGAAERGIDEGGGQLPRAADGQDQHGNAREGGARHRQRRRARHRQEFGGDHPRQQRLRGGEPRNQGASRTAGGGGAHPQ